MMRFLFLLNLLVAVGFPAHAAGQTTSAISVHRLTVGILEPRESLSDSAKRSSAHGLTLGIEEAQRTAKLFGWEVAVVRLPDSFAPIDGGNPPGAGVTAIVGDLTAARGTGLNRPSGPLLFDIGKQSGSVPAECADRAFQLLSTNEVNVVAWHPALERFGAAQLNDRYRKRFGSEMDERAWAGWMSIKILLDAALKTRTSDQCAIERFLLGAQGRFDGHKGVPLFFDPATRELVQPRYATRQSGEPEVVDVHDNQSALRGAPAVDCARRVEACA
jgi:hypothetical protein